MLPPARLRARFPFLAMATTSIPSPSDVEAPTQEDSVLSFRTALPLGLQFLFWTIYGVVFYGKLLSYLPFPSIAQHLTLWATGTGLAISTLMGLGLHLLLDTTLHPIGKTTGVLGTVVGSGAGWGGLYYSGAEALNPFAGPVLNQTATLPGQGALLTWPIAFPLLLLLWGGLALGVRHLHQQQAQRRQLLEAELAAERAHLRMLRYQLNPHFFFNALNTIGALAENAPGQVQTAIRELSGFLRYTLLDSTEDAEASAVQVVPLQDELEAAQHYLTVEKIRFEEELQWTMDLDEEAAAQRIPSFLILPLVENAIKHGQRTSPSPLRVSIRGQMTTAAPSGPSQLVLEVVNTGHLRSEENLRSEGEGGTGTGLDNVRARLDARYADHSRFALTEEAGRVRARIAIDTNALDKPSAADA